MRSGWIFPGCDLCGGIEGDDLLALKHRDAPAGVAFIRRCQECGLKRLWPRPGDEIIHRYYPSDYGAYIGRRRPRVKQALWDLLRDRASGAPGRGRTLKPLRPLFRLIGEWAFDTNVPLDQDPLPRILDVGCGFGDLLLYWKSRGADTMGVDFDHRAVEVANRSGLRVLEGGLEEQNFPQQSFDVIVFNHSLEHLPHPSVSLLEAKRLLRPGGTIHITVPNGASAGLAVENSSWEGLRFPVHFWFFDVETLSKILAGAGFNPVKVRSRNMWRDRLATLKQCVPQKSIVKCLQIMKMNITSRYKGDLISVAAVRK
jgi:2-polyprenyl-3-methyl-5-hydroxy-6-metoxy-1,4-benzoquinol methylase